MGGNDNQVSLSQNVTNSIFQSQQNTCDAQVTSIQTGDQVIVVGSRVSGNVGFEVQATVESSCVITNTIDTTVSNTLAAMLQQENTTLSGIIPNMGSQTNAVNALQTVSNYITQMTENTCSSTVINNQSNDIVYAQNTSVGGNVGFIDNGLNAVANCTFNNTTSLSVYNDMQATVTQSNKTVALLALIFVIIGVIIIVGIIVMGFTKFKSSKNKSNGLTDDELKLINEETGVAVKA